MTTEQFIARTPAPLVAAVLERHLRDFCGLRPDVRVKVEQSAGGLFVNLRLSRLGDDGTIRHLQYDAARELDRRHFYDWFPEHLRDHYLLPPARPRRSTRAGGSAAVAVEPRLAIIA